MIKTLKTLFLSSSAFLLMNVATVAISTASFIHHGEPVCPKELLK